MEPTNQPSKDNVEQQPQETPPLVPQVPPSIPQTNWLTWLLLLLLLFALGGGGYFAYQNYQLRQKVSQAVSTPTPSPAEAPASQAGGSAKEVDSITNWKTYRNEKNQFAFKYPEDLHIEVNQSGDNQATILSNRWKWKEYPPASEYIELLIRTIEVDPTVSLENWLKKYTIRPLPDGTNRSFVTGEMKSYQVGDLQSISFTGVVESEVKYVYMKKNQRVVELSLHGYGTGASYKQSLMGEKIFDQILSTFKFLQSFTTSDWQKYTNTKEGYTLQYPRTINNSQTLFKVFDNTNTILIGLAGDTFLFSVETDESDNDVVDWYVSKPNTSEYKKLDDMVVDGIHGKQIVITNYLQGFDGRVILLKKGKMNFALLLPTGCDFCWEPRLAEQIFSTFKFTN